MAKNYLFAPFKDDEDKINTFNHLKRYLPKRHRSDLIMFIGRLESYYDVIISDLSGKVAIAIKDEEIIISKEDKVRDLQAEINELNKENEQIAERNKEYHEQVMELKAELNKEEEFALEMSIKNDRLMEQVSSNRGNSSSSHTHTITPYIDALKDKHGDGME